MLVPSSKALCCKGTPLRASAPLENQLVRHQAVTPPTGMPLHRGAAMLLGHLLACHHNAKAQTCTPPCQWGTYLHVDVPPGDRFCTLARPQGTYLPTNVPTEHRFVHRHTNRASTHWTGIWCNAVMPLCHTSTYLRRGTYLGAAMP